MSEMFTKCNGFIVSGDPLVYADSATMTGQGTVSEPFGVKSTDLFVQEPLYTGTSGNSAYIGWRPDETVLYETTATTVSNTAVNLSEPTTAFERVKINFVASNDTKRGMWFEYNGNCSQFNTNVMRTDPAGIVQAWGDYVPSNNYSTLSFDYGRYFVIQKTTTATSIGDITFYITKVVGINRKV